MAVRLAREKRLGWRIGDEGMKNTPRLKGEGTITLGEDGRVGWEETGSQCSVRPLDMWKTFCFRQERERFEPKEGK